MTSRLVERLVDPMLRIKVESQKRWT